VVIDERLYKTAALNLASCKSSLARLLTLNQNLMFRIFKKTFEITFKDELSAELEAALTESYQILKKTGHSAQANCLKGILKSVIDRDTELFKKRVITMDLLGGSGSVLDVWLESEHTREQFEKSFNKFLNLTLQTGLTHRAVKQAERLSKIKLQKED
jgi:hypothetical protein